MKTNPRARQVLRIRSFVVCVMLSALGLVDLALGESLVARFGKAVPPPADIVQTPNVSLCDVLGSIR